MISKKVA